MQHCSTQYCRECHHSRSRAAELLPLQVYTPFSPSFLSFFLPFIFNTKKTMFFCKQECKADFRERRGDPEPEYRETNLPLLAHLFNKLFRHWEYIFPLTEHQRGWRQGAWWHLQWRGHPVLEEAITLSSSRLLTPTATFKPPSKCDYHYHAYSVNAEPEAYGG